jgi:hypothetical protein
MTSSGPTSQGIVGSRIGPHFSTPKMFAPWRYTFSGTTLAGTSSTNRLATMDHVLQGNFINHARSFLKTVSSSMSIAHMTSSLFVTF